MGRCRASWAPPWGGRPPPAGGRLVVTAARAGGRRARAAPGADAATDTLVGRDAPRAQATERCTSASATTRCTSSSAGRCRSSCSPRTSSACSGSRAASRGNVPKGQSRAAARTGRARGSRRPSRSRSSSGPGRSSTSPSRQIQDQFTAQSAAAARPRQAGGAARKLALARKEGRAREASKLGRAGQAARARAQFARDALQLALKYGITSAPQLNDPGFVSQLVFDRQGARGRRRRASPTCSRTKDSALIQVRLQPGARPSAQRDDAIALDPRRRSRCRDWRLANGGTLRRHRRAGRRRT